MCRIWFKQHMVQEQWLSNQVCCLNEAWTQWCLSGGAYSSAHFYSFRTYLSRVKYVVLHASLASCACLTHIQLHACQPCPQVIIALALSRCPWSCVSLLLSGNKALYRSEHADTGETHTMPYRSDLLPAERHRFHCLGNALRSHGTFFYQGVGLPPGLFPTSYMFCEALSGRLSV